jgi:hypothetical protein
VTSSERPNPRRKWLAIALATVVMMISYSAMLVAFIALEVEDGPAPGPLIALGLGLVPFVFLILAFVSVNRRAPGSVLKAMALSVLVGGLVSALMADAVSGLVAGFGVGGAVTLRIDEPESMRARFIAVALVTVYVGVLVNFSVEGGLFTGAVLPLMALGISDWISERRAEEARLRRERGGSAA